MNLQRKYQASLGQYTKEKLILALRHYFHEISDFGFPDSPIKSVFIREAYGKSIRNYPCIFVKIVNSKPQTLGIGKGFVGNVYSDDQLAYQKYLPGTENSYHKIPYRKRIIAHRYGYLADITFKLEVWGDTKYARNQIADSVVAALETYEKQKLMNDGIVLVSISENSENDFPLDDTQHVYTTDIMVTVNSQLMIDYPVVSITGVHVIQNFVPSNVDPDFNPAIVDNTLADDLF